MTALYFRGGGWGHRAAEGRGRRLAKMSILAFSLIFSILTTLVNAGATDGNVEGAEW